MASSLRVTRLRFIGRADSQSYEFPKRVTVITGPVGVGKSSMLNAIKYGLGGSWTIPRKIRGAVDAIELDVHIGDEHLKLYRLTGRNGTSVEVRVRGGGVQLLPIDGDEHELTLSRFLLLRLGIPDLRLPESSARPGERLTTVTFNDVLHFMYLDQDQIDGVVGFTGDQHRKWQQTFEVLYALADSEVVALQTELGITNGDHERASSYVRDAHRFLEAAGLTDAGTSALRQQRIDEELIGVDRALALARRGLATPPVDEHRVELQSVDAEIARRRDALAAQTGQLQALDRVASQLRTDRVNLERAGGAFLLRELEFEMCPRCLKDLPAVVHGACRVCHQPDDGEKSTSVAAEIERRRCERQLAETTAMIAEAQKAASEIALDLTGLGERRTGLQRAWNEATAAAVAPMAEEIERLSQRRGELLAARNELRDAARLAAELRAAGAERDRLAAEQVRLNSALAGARSARRSGLESLKAFSELYGDLLKQMDLPNMERGGSVDRKRYVPLVDGEAVKAQSSGGLKTMANFAYFLAALQLRLKGYPTYLPAFMMIDSPRKNHGSNDDDAASMERAYRLLSVLTMQRTSTKFQVIVADNDSPGEERDRFHQIELSREHKLIDIERLRGPDGADESPPDET
jgi:hypothetical protein